MSLLPSVGDALAGASFAPPSAAAGKTALVAGAAGKLGERVLSRLLSNPAYRRVYVLAAAPMASTEPKLVPLPAAEWNFPIDDIIAVVGEASPGPAFTDRPRTAVFTELSLQELMPLARLARAQGATRFMSITPINVLMQPAALRGGLSGLLESDLHQLGFASLLLVRPSDRVLRRRRRGFAERLMALLIETAGGLMTGERHLPLSIDDTARAVVHALQEEAKGLRVIEIEHLHGLLGG